jgi:hypothetical protein
MKLLPLILMSFVGLANANMCPVSHEDEPRTYVMGTSVISCTGCYEEGDKLMVPPNVEIAVTNARTPKVTWKFVNRASEPRSVSQVMNGSARRAVVPTLETSDKAE